ncbi:deoxymugineic acid synthase 1-D-like [Lolium rigidum]|uniref:deoxymugineic acid synthase 1-D-like n=1 Tax=Lolium rigidum TaxID=89674 RepID=UPI001F5D0E71|nr:deoxymugineic acid synthase 1-D-like [Lolium rigidum]
MASTAVAPEVALRSGNARPMPAIGMGTSKYPLVPETTRDAVLAAVEVGFRHFDTASLYGSERPVGEAMVEALQRGLVASREEVFITSKLWCTQCHPHLVLPSLQESLQNLQLEYVDMYLIHLPVSLRPGPVVFPAKREDAMPFDFEGVWREMEECHRLGLAKAIGVSNFTTRHLDKILAAATVPPAVNQVELNPAWQQRKLRAYCAEKGIHVAAYSPLGGQKWSGSEGNAVLESEVLAEIAKARGKSIAQVALRWIYEQGMSPIVKSFSKERLKQNLEIFDWELTDDDHIKIGQIPQKKIVQTANGIFSSEGEFTSVDLSDIEIVEE